VSSNSIEKAEAAPDEDAAPCLLRDSVSSTDEINFLIT
jgi:hypothetical protein